MSAKSAIWMPEMDSVKPKILSVMRSGAGSPEE